MRQSASLRIAFYFAFVTLLAMCTAILGLEIDDADQPIDWPRIVENRLKRPGCFRQCRSDFEAIRPNRELLQCVFLCRQVCS